MLVETGQPVPNEVRTALPHRVYGPSQLSVCWTLWNSLPSHWSPTQGSWLCQREASLDGSLTFLFPSSAPPHPTHLSSSSPDLLLPTLVQVPIASHLAFFRNLLTGLPALHYPRPLSIQLPGCFSFFKKILLF